MRNVCRGLLVLGLVVVLAQPSPAQQRRGRGQGAPGGIAALLQNESVQKELKLDQDQTEKVKEAVQKVRDKHKDEFAKLQDLSPEERRTKGRELGQAVSTETLEAVSTILKPDQVKRLKQIELQQEGVRAFQRPEVDKALNLTAEQKDKIKTITDDSNREMRELRGGGGGGQGNREKLAALRKETNDKIQAVLTDDQKKTWKELTGDSFQMQRGRRRGGNNQ